MSTESFKHIELTDKIIRAFTQFITNLVTVF